MSQLKPEIKNSKASTTSQISLASYGLVFFLLLVSLIQVLKAQDPRVAKGYLGAVASASPESSAAGLEMLKQGGNAADAIIATSFALAVTRPQSTGLGGGGFLIYHDAQQHLDRAYDFRETAPAAATRDMYQTKTASRVGPKAAGIPGLVKGLVELYNNHGSGRLSLAELMEPAIRLARAGFKIDAGLASACHSLRKTLAQSPAAAKVFLPGGRPLKVGELLIQEDLAKTLERIAKKGANDFYQGETARLIAKAMKRDGGLITKADLANYKTIQRQTLQTRYRGKTILTMPPPAGGMHLIQMLNILENFNLSQYQHFSAKHLHLLAETMKRAYADRAVHSGDPKFTKVPVEWLTSKNYARKLAKTISMDQATSSNEIYAGQAPIAKESNQTTHISVVDRFGNAASSTQTINTHLGSKYMPEGTGFLMNNEMDDFGTALGRANAFGAIALSNANLIEPGKRPLSSMTPSLVLDEQQRLIMVVGSPGGTKIMTTVLQVISNSLDFALDPKAAVFAPRVHHQWRNKSKLRFEQTRLPGAVANALKALGQEFYMDEPMGNVQAIFRDPESGLLTAVSDRRGTGRPAAR